MTVRELIETLQKGDLDEEVYIQRSTGELLSISRVSYDRIPADTYEFSDIPITLIEVSKVVNEDLF